MNKLGLKREGSKFALTEGATDESKDVLYRPEFSGGTASKAGTVEKMWELMDAYIGND